jgi:hypothetical protein
MNTTEIGKEYVALCKEGKFETCLQELYSKDAVSVEAWAPPGIDRVATGLRAIQTKGEAWGRDHEIHRMELSEAFPLDDRFAVRFLFEVTNKPSNRRSTMEEIGVFTVENGKIVREEFFYNAG